MNKSFFLMLGILCSTLLGFEAVAQKNLSILGQLDYAPVGATDIWGYVDSSGNEYALVGLENGVSIVDVSTDPANPNELFFIPGIQSGWRDLKTWQTYAYVTNEDGNGLLVIDLTDLPNSIQNQNITFGGQLNTAHNVFVDEKGFAYIVGTDVISGAMFLDLNTDPYNPSWVGSYNVNYVHDVFVRGDTMWSAEINAGIFSVVDVSSKQSPVVMATKSTPSNFTHNLWLSDDGNSLYTTDEVSNAFIASYDVSNINNITELDRYQSSPGENVIPHNTFVLGDFLVTSYYRDGVVITDATQPDNMIEVGNYDTSPLSGNGFNGCWGVYPYLPSGNIIASDMEGGLFVLAPTYAQGCYLEGTVTDSATGALINGVDVEILQSQAMEVTGLSGEYKSGVADAGSYDVSFSKPGYNTRVISNVALNSGVITIQDAELSMLPPFAFSINVVEAGSQNPIPNASSTVKNAQFSFEETGNGSGVISIPAFFEGNYDIIVGRWGYRTRSIPAQTIDATSNVLTVELTKGYYDDFALDFEWQKTATASSGFWEKGVPEGTFYQGAEANPGMDVPDDISNECYVTGNGGGGAGNDDIDDGEVVLNSPVFDLSGYSDPYIQYDRWFFNDGGFGGPPNDSLVISISNGLSTEVVEVITNASGPTSVWVFHEFRIFDYVAPTANMMFSVRAVDSDPGHLVEAALDHFQVVDSSNLTSIESNIGERIALDVSVYPNPAADVIRLEISAEEGQSYSVELLDVLGNHLAQIAAANNGNAVISHDIRHLSEGLYFIHLISGETRTVRKLLVTK